MPIALVTGGSAGIGQATALELARQGVDVITTYRSHRSESDATIAEVEALGGTAVTIPLDLNDIDGLGDVVARVRGELDSRWGGERLTSVVNNAGVGGPAMFEEITEETFDRFHHVLFKGPYFLTQGLVPLMADGGAIVNVGSTAALPGRVTAGYSAYGASKAAMHAVTGYWAAELAGRRIRVNAVAPGSTRTRLGDDAFAKHPELVTTLAAGVALGRIGEPEDVARVIAFLLGAASGWITGQVIEVSGGDRL